MIRRLAKLRQFRSGMDIEGYLTGELRQNWLAIEQAFRRVGVETSDDEVATVGTVVLLSSVPTISSGTILITESNSVLNSGTITSSVFYPDDEARYAIKWGFTGNVQNNASTSSATVSCLNGLTSLGTAAVSLATSVASVPMVAGNSNMVFYNLGPNSGVSFSLALVNIASASRFWCEIIKVS